MLVSLQSVNRGLGVRYMSAKANDSVNTINQGLHVSCVVSNRLSLKKNLVSTVQLRKRHLELELCEYLQMGKNF